MTKIVPAVLVPNKEMYIRRLAIIKHLTDRFQLDIIDGQFVENKTVQLGEISRQTELKMDIHLMVQNPQSFVDQAIGLHAYTTIIQYECEEDITPYLERLKKSGLRGGVSINPSTSINKLKPFVELVDYVQLMAYPAGFAGQKLQPEVFEILPKLRKMFPSAELGLDGGINEKTAKKVFQAGFDVVNINSYLFGADDPLSQYSQLLEFAV